MERRPSIGRQAVGAVGNGAKGVVGGALNMVGAPFKLIRRLSRGRMPDPLHIGVAVDNSRLSDKSVQFACDFFQGLPGDCLNLLHIIVNEKRVDHRSPQVVRSKYEGAAAKFGMPANAITWTEKALYDHEEKRKPLTEVILNLAAEQEVDMLFFGSLASTRDANHIIGSKGDNDTVLLQSPVNVCFVKGSSFEPDSHRTFVLATSVNGVVFRQMFEEFVEKYVKAGDVVHVVYARSDRMSPISLDSYADKLRRLGIQGECVINQMNTGEHIGQVFSQFAATKGADFLVFGIEPFKDCRKLYGTAPEECSRISRTNVIVYKVYDRGNMSARRGNATSAW
eukprot:CAMPEP_0197844280 /NCGR_PEP_ID=MMETSP1438-20131217/1268_1 /TAXON_ID=1461541 /ORGANISM="Pterosperma sp., Strain CCMP1384" /LENGTH=337 /DNA_ID=CAMNT_0043454991 /DNA_START=174 /DNA_END=1184 /DNA_ORIENTATION=-